ncbi:MAG: type I-U CRISPR-associated protein Csx17 [Planctomycetes bacterium]|nr:type I-U CRISPR-associated protein Csx17 [Planctomycetota bacterium]
MADERYSIELSGCAPIPLAHYLKALGILRLVSAQVDQQAQGWWEGDTFWLRSTLDRKGLIEFFLQRYEPTPLVAPWNGGSGFFSSDNQEALLAILHGKAGRLGAYREIIGLCQALLKSMSLEAKPDSDLKARLLLVCRNRFPDTTLQWLDAAYVLTGDGPKYPPLLGTGGNDGRLEFTNNYMQRLCELMDPETGQTSDPRGDALSESVFGDIGHGRSKSPIGQFDPGGAGGANATSGYDAASSINSWDYLLMLEGALAFASATVKRLEYAEIGVLSYPFCVQSAGVGYGSADEADEAASRNEMWFPLWDAPASLGELTSLLAEGRVERRGRRARNGVDFARAIASLGVDRGIRSFERYGFQQRNGLAYFAVPLGRFAVRGNPGIEELLAPLDSWLDRFRRVATSKTAPARVGRASRLLEAAIFELCQRGGKRHVQNVLIALGQAEAAIAISPKLRNRKEKGYVSPVPQLSSQWFTEAYLGLEDIEFRLAAALAGIGYGREDKVGPFRRHVEPIDSKNTRQWSETDNDPALVWAGGDLVRNMLAVLNRRMIDAVRYGKQPGDDELLFPGEGRYRASLGDIAAFIDGHVDDRRIESLLRGLILVNWQAVEYETLKQLRGLREPMPDAAYALLKLCHIPHGIAGKAVRLPPAITRRAASGNLTEATRSAARRLNASGLPPAVGVIHGHGERARRTAAALLFPVWHNKTTDKTDVTRLMNLVLRQEDRSESTENNAEAADSTSAAV